MNPHLAMLQAYPFERLRTLLQGVEPAAVSPIDFSIGEPRQAAPTLVAEAIKQHVQTGLSAYPKVAGEPELRAAIARWAEWRFDLPSGFLTADRHILPANGSREALFSVAQAVVDPSNRPLVLLPNPFYQIYEGAALLAGAEPVYLNCDASGQPNYRDIPESTWERCSLLYINSPHNPTGAALAMETLGYLIHQARRYGFVLAADECYSEIWTHTPPPGILSAAAQTGSLDQVLAFHSLSKRSSIPGARSGFIAGDAVLLQDFQRYRTYLGNAMPPFIQAASVAAWDDEVHVEHSRRLYQEKFALAQTLLGSLLDLPLPDGGFYLWLKVGDGEAFTRALYAEHNVRCLPGAYLARYAQGSHPGADRVRIALVGELETCRAGLERIAQFLPQFLS